MTRLEQKLTANLGSSKTLICVLGTNLKPLLLLEFLGTKIRDVSIFSTPMKITLQRLPTKTSSIIKERNSERRKESVSRGKNSDNEKILKNLTNQQHKTCSFNILNIPDAEESS
jgi:hypothetical protein